MSDFLLPAPPSTAPSPRRSPLQRMSTALATAGPGISVRADTTDSMLSYVAGVADQTDVGVAASAILDHMDSTTDASVGQGATIVSTGASAAQGVFIHAENDTQRLGIAGDFAGAKEVGFGAAGDIVDFNKNVHAFIAPSADVSARNNVVLESLSRDGITSESGGSAMTDGGLSSLVAHHSRLDRHARPR